jgi:hypothetical protein
MNIQKTFSVGDQSNIARLTFLKNKCKKCYKCNSSNILFTKYVCGCRMNGDGYGVEVYKCNDCNWETSYLYDENDNCDYYFEINL